MRVAIALLVLGACGFEVPAGTAMIIDAAEIDDAPDAMVGTVGDVCYGTLVRPCFPVAPAGALILDDSAGLDTTDASNCTLVYAQTDGAEVCVIAGDTITVGAFAVTGERPLVLVAATGITVMGTLDVSSKTVPARRGAGAQGLACTTSGAGTNDRGGGGGGGGGTFSTRGGTGGVGDKNSNGPPTGMAPGGMSGIVQAAPVTLRGGCRGGVGGEGGDSDGVNPGGRGGIGGGAVALVSGGSITINGAIYASGAGGDTMDGQGGVGNCQPGNGGFEQGGGGGGSGGMVVLDGMAIAVPGKIAANGGGGGGGGGCRGGTRGADGSTVMWNVQALGGFGDLPNAGANGGPGSARGGATSLDGLTDDSGGGGGGGGLGYVWTKGPLAGGVMISPAPVTQ